MEGRELSRRAFAAASISALSYGRILGANDRISVGMIGCGRRGLLNEVLKFHKESNLQVSALCDTWRQQREAAVAKVRDAAGNTPDTYVHYRDVLALPGIDAVVIGTPDHQHCRMLADAARAKKDAYCEKPLAMEWKELNIAVDAVKRNNRVVLIGTQVRSWPGPAAAAAFIRSGGLGKVLKIEQARNGYKPYWHGYGERKVEEADVDWKAFLMHRRYRPFNADQYAAWYGYRDFTAGPHSNLAVHFMDLVHYFTGAKYPLRAVTMGGIYRWKDARTCPDSIETILEYPQEGFMARYSSVFGNGAGSYMKVFGTRGVLDCSNWGKLPEISGDGSQEPDKIAPGTKVPEVEVTHHMKNFFDCVRSRKEPMAPIDAGYGHSIAALLSDEAFVRGRRMVYDPAAKKIREA
ncbi:MAG: Gfo/Idh/MocA family oxidoreductase [Bryobacteraceae bacterium]